MICADLAIQKQKLLYFLVLHSNNLDFRDAINMVSLSLLSTENQPYLLGDAPEMLRQYLAGVSVHWPDFSELWADFSSWLSQPRESYLRRPARGPC